MGTVYEALEPDLERKVALKVLSPEASTDHETVSRFKREAKVLTVPSKSGGGAFRVQRRR
jgi:serine/threonine protein kinase